jgi:hypothetical protein
MSHGMLTAQVAHLLQEEINEQEFDVLHDHGQKLLALRGSPTKWEPHSVGSRKKMRIAAIQNQIATAQENHLRSCKKHSPEYWRRVS